MKRNADIGLFTDPSIFGRLTQRESATFTRWKPQVRILYRPSDLEEAPAHRLAPLLVLASPQRRRAHVRVDVAARVRVPRRHRPREARVGPVVPRNATLRLSINCRRHQIKSR